MSLVPNADLDLVTSRLIKAPAAAVWDAWAKPANFEKWWIPAPAICRVVEMDLRPGGALETEMDENGQGFQPHLKACFLEIEEGRKIVFTNALTKGWRPAEQAFMTAIITLEDAPEGTLYTSMAMHKSAADRKMHDELGFHDGWGTVARQLAELVERP